MTMNKSTTETYEFFSGDPEAVAAVDEMVASGKPSSVVANWLEEYVLQLSILDLLRVYKQLLVPATQATNWEEVANMLLCDRLDACGSEVSIPEWDDDFNSNIQ